MNSVYYFNDGNTPNSLFIMNLLGGKFTAVKAPLLASSVFYNGKIIGFIDSQIVALDLTSYKTTVLYPNAPALVSAMTPVFDIASNSYIFQTLNDGPEIYYWWALNLATNKTRQANSNQMFQGGLLCPAKL